MYDTQTANEDQSEDKDQKANKAIIINNDTFKKSQKETIIEIYDKAR